MLPNQLKIIILAEIVFVLLVGVFVYNLFTSHNQLVAEHEQLKHAYEIEIQKKSTVEIKSPNTLPVVVYERGGLLTEEEKKRIHKQLIEPYALFYDYHHVTMLITVPEHEGEQFDVRTIFENGEFESFNYGMRGDVLEYWTPSCLGECYFSEKFRAAYPHIIENAEAP